MDRTQYRNYPFPECDPPRVKDASDIAQLRDLALAIDADAAGRSDSIAQFWERPDSAGMTGSATNFPFPFSSTQHTQFTVPYDTVVFDNSGTNSLTDISRNAFVIAERGFYVFTAMVRVLGNPGFFTQLGIRFQNANRATAEGRHYQGVGAYLGTELAWNAIEVLPCSAGDLVTTQMTFGPTGNSGTVNLGVRAGMIQVQKLDV